MTRKLKTEDRGRGVQRTQQSAVGVVTNSARAAALLVAVQWGSQIKHLLQNSMNTKCKLR